MASSCSICCFLNLSSSECFFSSNSFWASSVSCCVSASLILRWHSSILRANSASFCFSLFSARSILLLRAFTCFSCSAFICRNFSFACKILSFLITSASASASLMMFLLLYFKVILISRYPRTNPTIRAITPVIIIVIIFVTWIYSYIIYFGVFCLYKKPASFLL